MRRKRTLISLFVLFIHKTIGEPKSPRGGREKTFVNTCTGTNGLIKVNRFPLKWIFHPLGPFSHSGHVTEFLKKYGNLQTNFPDLEKVWKLRLSLEKHRKNSGIFSKLQLHVNYLGQNVLSRKPSSTTIECMHCIVVTLCLQCITVLFVPALVEQRKWRNGEMEKCVNGKWKEIFKASGVHFSQMSRK